MAERRPVEVACLVVEAAPLGAGEEDMLAYEVSCEIPECLEVGWL